MTRIISQKVRTDIEATVRHAKESAGVVNISTLAEQVRQRNEAENVALEDIAGAMIRSAQAADVPCVFDPDELSLCPSVSIVPSDTDWTVQVFENGRFSEQTFGTREWAENFANGQRARLGVRGDDRLQ